MVPLLNRASEIAPIYKVFVYLLLISDYKTKGLNNPQLGSRWYFCAFLILLLIFPLPTGHPHVNYIKKIVFISYK
jgi:hypothetical protein